MTNEEQAGIAVAAKRGIQHKLLDESNEDILGLEVETNRRKIIIITAYCPQRYGDLELQNLLNLIRKSIPVYIFADLNAKHPLLGHRAPNNMGKITT